MVVMESYNEVKSIDVAVSKIINDGLKSYNAKLFTECAKSYRMYLLLGGIGGRREELLNFIEENFVFRKLNGFDKLKYPVGSNVNEIEELIRKTRSLVMGNHDNEISAIKEILEHFYESKASVFLRNGLLNKNNDNNGIVEKSSIMEKQNESVLDLSQNEVVYGVYNSEEKTKNNELKDVSVEDVSVIKHNLKSAEDGLETVVGDDLEVIGDSLLEVTEAVLEVVEGVLDENKAESFNTVEDTVIEVEEDDVIEEEKILKITKVSKEGFCGICATKILDKSQSCFIKHEGEEHEVHVNCAVEYSTEFETSDNINTEMLDNFIEEQLPLGKTYGTAQRALSALRRNLKKQGVLVSV